MTERTAHATAHRSILRGGVLGVVLAGLVATTTAAAGDAGVSPGHDPAPAGSSTVVHDRAAHDEGAQPASQRLDLYVASRSTTVRTGPSWRNRAVRVIGPGTVLEASHVMNGWLRIREGQWVLVDHLDRVTRGTTRWTTGSVNVRYGPSTRNSVMDTLPAGRRLEGPVVNGWQRIADHRWVSTAVTSSTPPDRPALRRSSVDTSRKVVYLTFDDGPHPTWTPRMLEVLAKHDVHATFFMVGSEATGRPELVRRVRAAGHAVGNHTWSHPSLTSASSAKVKQELTSTNRAIGGATCFRAPYGAVNRAVDRAAGQVGLRYSWLWSVDPRDWERPGADAIADAVVKGARPGAVHVMHDGGGNRSQSVEGVDRALTRLKAKGYTVEPLPGC
ncbi:polysaccharide deacetylase family protein [Kytococcus sedentarius]|uniref:polysaccharide deacetylase family protein n=1 Tax=Kytococcus sedentarius TaxID=1276 RepID=UPI001EF2D736|nr:polysaccharide deacetylase family protein [Kytococcus sedentarius]